MSCPLPLAGAFEEICQSLGINLSKDNIIARRHCHSYCRATANYGQEGVRPDRSLLLDGIKEKRGVPEIKPQQVLLVFSRTRELADGDNAPAFVDNIEKFERGSRISLCVEDVLEVVPAKFSASGNNSDPFDAVHGGGEVVLNLGGDRTGKLVVASVNFRAYLGEEPEKAQNCCQQGWHECHQD